MEEFANYECEERVINTIARDAVIQSTIPTHISTVETVNCTSFEDMKSSENNKNLEDVLEEIGEFNRFQVIVLCLISIPMLFNSIFSVTYIFTASSVAHRCFITECDTTESSYYEPWTDWAIPRKDTALDKCTRYAGLNNATDQLCVKEQFQPSILEKCTEGDYIYRDKEITIANEFGIYCNDEWKLTLVGTINNVGQFLGIPLGGYISDRYGRTVSLALGGTLAGFIGLIRSYSPNYIFFLTFEFLDTLLSGTLYSTCFIVGVELVGPKRRVIACSLITIFYAVGEIILGIVAKYVQNWRIILRIVYTPAIAQIALFWILPESVRWLLSQRKEERAKIILRKAAEINKRKLSEDSLNKLIINNRCQLAKSQEKKFPVKIAFFKLHWRIINCSFCWIVNVLVYYGISLSAVLLDGDKYNNFMYIALIEIPGFFLPCIIMDRFGRRYSLCSTMIVSGVCCFLTIFITADKYYLSLILFLLGKLAITTSFQILYFFTSEIFPTNMRNSLLSFCSMVGRFGSMLAPQTPLLAKYNKNAPPILFAITAILSGLLTLCFPETTNLALPLTMKDAREIKSKNIVKL